MYTLIYFYIKKRDKTFQNLKCDRITCKMLQFNVDLITTWDCWNSWVENQIRRKKIQG